MQLKSCVFGHSAEGGIEVCLLAEKDEPKTSPAPERVENAQDSSRQQAPDFRADDLLKQRNDVIPKTSEQANPVQADGNVKFSNIFDTTAKKDGKEEPPRQESSKFKANINADRPIELGSLMDRGPGLSNKDGENVKATSFKISGDLSKIDPKKPTVAFLDDASVKEISLDKQSLDHAHASALAAQKGGYNALVFDVSKSNYESAANAMMKSYGDGKAPGAAGKAIEAARQELLKSGGDPIGLDQFAAKKDILGAAKALSAASNDLSKPISEVAAKVEKGELPLGRGDVLNVSMGKVAEYDKNGKEKPGTGDPSFADLSKKVGFEVTPENVRENTDKILDKFKDISKDSSDPVWQARAQEALRTNAAIDRLQATGVEVAHAASNDGNERIDINFLKAKHELQSVNPETGQRDKFSGAGNQSVDGSVPIYRTDSNHRDAVYSMAGKEFTNKELQVLNGDVVNSLPLSKPGVISMPDKLAGTPEDLKNLYNKAIGRAEPPTKVGANELTAVAVGNSFNNIRFLQDNLSRLRALKQDNANLRA